MTASPPDPPRPKGATRGPSTNDPDAKSPHTDGHPPPETAANPPAEERCAPSSGGASKLGPRSGRRRQDSRRRLLDAARRLFVARGYHDTRPQDIAREAEVGHGTFYLHFPDKRACFFDFAEEACAEVDAMIWARLEGLSELDEKIGAVIDAILEYHRDHPGVLTAALGDADIIGAGEEVRTSLTQRWADQWARELSQRAEGGSVHRDYDWQVVGLAIMGMLQTTAAVLAAEEEGRRRMSSTLKTFIVRALQP